MSTTLKTLLVTGLFAVACGDGNNEADRGLNSSAPGSDEIVVDVSRDVRDNLAIHFRGAAGKPPAGTTDIRFDFNEISREVSNGTGVVTGDFLFAVFGEQKRQGSITIYYTPGGDSWLRTGHFDVAENADVASHLFALTVRDASTDIPMAGALAEARRVDAGRVTNATFTDVLGQMQMQVLPGAFDIEVRQDNYEPVILRNVTTLDAVQQLGVIHLVPLTSKVTIF
ncbi:MAG TPA: hypothetical protein QGF95_21295 [Candidatus Latescibacteria bacterium]|jgi:hypothetical protein|nr:hypothetical protein [Candidatus Latescibacterota bacterium]HJP33089.1 hypothetical protein [Candidatus Latescibacterota bacterium]